MHNVTYGIKSTATEFLNQAYTDSWLTWRRLAFLPVGLLFALHTSHYIFYSECRYNSE